MNTEKFKIIQKVKKINFQLNIKSIQMFILYLL